jgi:hypothetical protein
MVFLSVHLWVELQRHVLTEGKPILKVIASLLETDVIPVLVLQAKPFVLRKHAIPKSLVIPIMIAILIIFVQRNLVKTQISVFVPHVSEICHVQENMTLFVAVII